MTRQSEVSIKIYRRHLALFRYLNDIWIFITLLRPHLKERAIELRNSKRKAKYRYETPKRGRRVESRRKDEDIGEVYLAQFERGVFDTHIINIVSRTEAFIQECVSIAVRAHPEKLTILSEKSGIPIELFLEQTDRAEILDRLVAMRCQDLMFGKPKEYLSRAFKVLGVTVNDSIVAKYIELKATRDVLIHNNGLVNKIYIDKVGNELARADIGQELEINARYFKEVIMIVKELSGSIQSDIEKNYK
jgi:hypothetical protein